MEEIAKVIMFFFKAEAIVLILFILIRGMKAYKMGSVALLSRKSDTELLLSLTTVAILASLMYSWTI